MYGTRGQLARLLKYATPSKDSHPGTEAKTEIKSEPNDVSTDPMDCDEAAGSTTDQGYSSSQEYIRKLQNTVATLESDLKKSKNLRNKQSREIHKLRDSVKRSSMHIADLKKSQAENTSHPNQSRQDLLNQIQALEETLQEQYDEFTQDNDELAHRLSALQRLRKDERTYLTEKNQDLLHQLEKTQADLHSTSNDLRKIQDSIFTRSHSEWPVEDDCKIREDVARISRDIRAWAKTYGASGESIPTRPIVVDEEGLNEFTRKVSSVAKISNFDEIRSMKHAFLLLAALLAEEIRLLIFKSPFFWLKGNKKTTYSWLDQAFLEMCKYRPSEAQTWRVELMHVLCGNGDKTENDKTVAATVFQNRVTKLCKDFSKDFFSSSEAMMLKVMDAEELARCGQDLEKLVTRAVSIYVKLQTQPSVYKWSQPTKFLGKPFSVASDCMKADRLHKIDEDENDTAMDGAQVKIVLSPAVFAYGNAQGEDIEGRRCIAKAVVYLE
ncbi:hypothetical protein IWZ01DRAFT_570720 [Phyllosticta capitalensis]